MRKPDLTLLGAVLSLCGVVAIGGVFIYRALQPPPLVFNSVAIDDVTPFTATLTAEVTRKALPRGCTNGIQADVRTNGSDEPDRLPVPLRTQDYRGRSEYALVLPSLPAGTYEIQVRETVLCGGDLEIIPTPWVRMDIPNASS